MSIVQTAGGTVFTGEGITVFHLIVLRNGLKLEKKGMKISKGKSALACAKRMFGLSTNDRAVYIELISRELELIKKEIREEIKKEGV